jgi:hypothetical protein
MLLEGSNGLEVMLASILGHPHVSCAWTIGVERALIGLEDCTTVFTECGLGVLVLGSVFFV